VAFSNQTVEGLCETVAEETSAPGGGSVAAIAGALAASLVAMAARFSREDWKDAAGVVAQAEALRIRLLPLADEDAHDVATLATEVALRGNPNLRGDAATGALLAEAAVRATANLVEINLATREGDERIQRARELVEMTRRLCRQVLEPAP
jgi:formiminotetrahydrofolate cyclodeaminase